MRKFIPELIADVVGMQESSIIKASQIAPSRYKVYQIKKRSGGYRIIHHPSKITKTIQYALITTILSELPIHVAAIAYRHHISSSESLSSIWESHIEAHNHNKIRSPILKNATLHAQYKYSVRIDFKDFFPSIRAKDLFKAIDDAKIFLDDPLNEKEKEFLCNSLFLGSSFHQTKLAIGAPSSPIVSNAVMYRLDTHFALKAKDLEGVYTRYADDIYFSCNDVGVCNTFLSHVRKLVQATDSPSLTINDQKTFFSSRKVKRRITGLIVCPDGTISIGRDNKRYIKKLIHEYITNKISEDRLKYLRGYLSYILDVDHQFYFNLSLKYSAEVLSSILPRRTDVTNDSGLTGESVS